jgi:uncharacterized membrane protein YphA (DoxX/SURF4 family)
MSSSSARTINPLLWAAQIVVALLFLFAGSMKFIMPAAKLQQGPVVLPIAFIHFIGVCECLGALGLVLPGVLRFKTARRGTHSAPRDFILSLPHTHITGS